jgi:hypothetical protein
VLMEYGSLEMATQPLQTASSADAALAGNIQ